jgi:hypothetical protein
LIQADGDTGLINYLDLFEEAIVLPDDGLEIVRIQRDIHGNVIVATTQKVPNLRFRLGDLLLESLGTGMSVAGSLEQPLKLALTSIRFLRALRKMATIDIGRAEAEVLIAIYRLAQEEAIVRVDDLLAAVPGNADEGQLARTLENLELLACIQLGMDGITLNETIMVQRLD